MKKNIIIVVLLLSSGCKQIPHKSSSSLRSVASDAETAALIALMEEKTKVRGKVSGDLSAEECAKYTELFRNTTLDASEFAHFTYIDAQPVTSYNGKTSFGTTYRLTQDLTNTSTDYPMHLNLNLGDLPSSEAFTHKVRFMSGVAKIIKDLATQAAPKFIALNLPTTEFYLSGFSETYGNIDASTATELNKKLQELKESLNQQLQMLLNQGLPQSNVRKSSLYNTASTLKINLFPGAKVPKTLGRFSEDDSGATADLVLDVRWSTQQINNYLAQITEQSLKGQNLLRQSHDILGRRVEPVFTDFSDESIARLTKITTTLQSVRPLVNKRLGPEKLGFSIYPGETSRTFGGYDGTKTWLTIGVDDLSEASLPGYFGAFVKMSEQTANGVRLVFSSWKYSNADELIACSMPKNPQQTCTGAPSLSRITKRVDPAVPTRILYTTENFIDLTINPSILVEILDRQRKPIARQAFSFKK